MLTWEGAITSKDLNYLPVSGGEPLPPVIVKREDRDGGEQKVSFMGLC